MMSFNKSLTWLGQPVVIVSTIVSITVSTIVATDLVLADSDHEEARRLRESGNVLPLETILQKLQASHPGKVIEVELENENDNVIYEITLLDNNNNIWEVKVNARTGELLQKKEDD